MKTARCTDGNTEFSPGATPSVSVRCGEIFSVQTELCSGPWLTSPHIVWRRELEKPGNFLSCVQVEDAVPGDILAVHIRDIRVDRLCYTGLEGRATCPYPGEFLGADYDESSYVKIMELQENGFHWGSTKFPLRPMAGCIGTARPDGSPDKDTPHLCGGNLDVRDVRPGTTVYLPVLTEKALLFLGDVHAMQGDGELNGWAAECRGELELELEKCSPFPFAVENSVLAERDDALYAFGFGKGFENAYNASVKALLDFAAFRSRRERKDIYVRMGLAMQSYVAQSCFPQWPVFVSYISKEFL